MVACCNVNPASPVPAVAWRAGRGAPFAAAYRTRGEAEPSGLAVPHGVREARGRGCCAPGGVSGHNGGLIDEKKHYVRVGRARVQIDRWLKHLDVDAERFRRDPAWTRSLAKLSSDSRWQA